MKLPIPVLLCCSALLAACDPLTLGLMTAGGGAAVNHQLSATATRTFSTGAEPVRLAALAALDHMSIQVTHSERHDEIERIEARAGYRTVTLRIEPVTRTSTQLAVAVHQDLLTLDGATGREIVAQTELALNQQAGGSDAGRLAGVPSASDNGTTGHTTYYGYDKRPAPARPAAKLARARTRPSTASTAGSASAASPSATASASAAANAAPGSMVTGNPLGQLAAASAP